MALKKIAILQLSLGQLRRVARWPGRVAVQKLRPHPAVHEVRLRQLCGRAGCGDRTQVDTSARKLGKGSSLFNDGIEVFGRGERI